MTPPPMTRAARLAALENRQFDLLVIGGGITGCGIARNAALRGLSVALVEKDDFASGTSSRSSRLIHGGVRYLEHGQLHLVFESSAERRRLLRIAPHLVRPLAFTWPVYAGARISRWKLDAGLWVYDALALFGNVARHHRLSRDGVLELEPRLTKDGLRGGARYFDAATNDARLTLANAVAAEESGAVVLNHAIVTELAFANGRVAGALASSALENRSLRIRASSVVNATGPWSDDVRELDHTTTRTVRGSKGAHIAVTRERIGNRDALTLLSPVDQRVLFALPAGKHAIIGTTDSYSSSRPDAVRATNEDVQYLLAAANSFFPAAQVSGDDVVSAWAGIRPLVSDGNESPGAASREHAVGVSASGLVSITGGKLTTYRIMANDAVNAAFAQLGRTAPADTTAALALPGGDFPSLDALIATIADATNDRHLSEHLACAYGSRWMSVLDEIRKQDGAMPVADGLPYTIGELHYCVHHEMASTLGDLLMRRTHVAFETRDHGIAAADRVARALASHLGWDADAQSRAVEDYARESARMFTIG